MEKIDRLLIAVDFTEDPLELLQRAQLVASVHNPDVTLLHVVPDYYRTSLYMESYRMRVKLQKSASKAAEQEIKPYAEMLDGAFKSVTTLIEEGDPAIKIVETAQKIGADLIIVGDHCRTGMSHWIHPNVAEKVLRTARKSVLSFYVDAN